MQFTDRGDPMLNTHYLEGSADEAAPSGEQGVIPVNLRVLPETAERFREILRQVGRERAEARAVLDRPTLDRTRLHVFLLVSIGRELGFNNAEQARLLDVSRQALHKMLKKQR